jgi:hypothetical protein
LTVSVTLGATVQPTAISTTTEFAAHAQPEVCLSGVLAIADEVIE